MGGREGDRLRSMCVAMLRGIQEQGWFLRRLPALNAVRTFEALARHVSFTKAADELHVTHWGRSVDRLRCYGQKAIASSIFAQSAPRQPRALVDRLPWDFRIIGCERDLHTFRDIDQTWSRLPHGCGANGVVDHLGQPIAKFHEMIMVAVPGDADRIAFLKGVGADGCGGSWCSPDRFVAWSSLFQICSARP